MSPIQGPKEWIWFQIYRYAIYRAHQQFPQLSMSTSRNLHDMSSGNMAWDGLLVCMVQVLHVLQLFSHPGLPWLQTSYFFVSWRNAFLLSLIFSTPPLHSYSLGTLVPARQVHKMQKTCSWAPFECIAGQNDKNHSVPPSQIFMRHPVKSSQITNNRASPNVSPSVRIQRLASATHSSPSPSIKTTSSTTQPATWRHNLYHYARYKWHPFWWGKKLLIFRCCGHPLILLSFQSVSSDNLTVGIGWKPRAACLL